MILFFFHGNLCYRAFELFNDIWNDEMVKIQGRHTPKKKTNRTTKRHRDTDQKNKKIIDTIFETNSNSIFYNNKNNTG